MKKKRKLIVLKNEILVFVVVRQEYIIVMIIHANKTNLTSNGLCV